MGSHPLNFIHLRKAELEYEVLIRGGEIGTCLSLRKQINHLAKKYTSDDIQESGIDETEDLNSVKVTLSETAQSLDEINTETGVLKAITYKNHIKYRLARINPTTLENITQKQKLEDKYNTLLTQLSKLENKYVTGGSQRTESTTPPVTNISVTCTSHVPGKPKYDGKTCVRSFIQKLEEFRVSKQIRKDDMFNHAFDIFTDNALHWYRHQKLNVTTWDELLHQLKSAFDTDDYDYRLLTEIRLRTQGETENITVYISIMCGLFNRLNVKPSETEIFDIITHNLRPMYAEVLAISNVQSLDQLQIVCKNYEKYKTRAAHYQEPSKSNLLTLAPEFAYTKTTNKPTDGTNTYRNQYRYGRNRYYGKTDQPREDSQLAKPIALVNTNETESTRRGVPFCPRCRTNAHSLRRCTVERFPICFKCGEKGVIYPTCTKCNPKN